MNRQELIIPRDMDEITTEPDHQRQEVERSTINTYRKEEKLNVGDPVPELELERLAAAQLYSEKLSLTIPTLVDGMDNAAAEIFAAWPERIYILNEGKIQYKADPGPYEFNPEETIKSLMQLLNTQ